MAEPARPPGGGGAGSEGLGRSRGGFTSKLHLSADGRCRPLSLIVTPGQRADCTQFKQVLDKIRVPEIGPGRPRKKPDRLAADKAYSNRIIRAIRGAGPERGQPAVHRRCGQDQRTRPSRSAASHPPRRGRSRHGVPTATRAPRCATGRPPPSSKPVNPVPQGAAVTRATCCPQTIGPEGPVTSAMRTHGSTSHSPSLMESSDGPRPYQRSSPNSAPRARTRCRTEPGARPFPRACLTHRSDGEVLDRGEFAAMVAATRTQVMGGR
ncbi:transposase [Actinacidiphila glaucinigra]|uniref:transposase n=1 Tax=Actinacidiphila glaucinigra TaxID=235986 RepID=UPI0038682E56